MKDGFPDALPCSKVVVVPWLAKSALASAGLLYDGLPVDPVKLPKNVCAAAFVSEYEITGVVVGVAVVDVNSGERAFAVTVVTVPPVPVALIVEPVIDMPVPSIISDTAVPDAEDPSRRLFPDIACIFA